MQRKTFKKTQKMVIMAINAKTLIKDKFWIIEEDGQKLGTLQKQENNGWIFLSKREKKEIFHTNESLREKFGIDITQTAEKKIPVEIPSENLQVHGYPVTQQPYNQCLMYKSNFLSTQKLPSQKVYFVQDIT